MKIGSFGHEEDHGRLGSTAPDVPSGTDVRLAGDQEAGGSWVAGR